MGVVDVLVGAEAIGVGVKAAVGRVVIEVEDKIEAADMILHGQIKTLVKLDQRSPSSRKSVT